MAEKNVPVVVVTVVVVVVTAVDGVLVLTLMLVEMFETVLDVVLRLLETATRLVLTFVRLLETPRLVIAVLVLKAKVVTFPKLTEPDPRLPDALPEVPAVPEPCDEPCDEPPDYGEVPLEFPATLLPAAGPGGNGLWSVVV